MQKMLRYDSSVFRIISKIEDGSEDTIYFAKKTGLESKMNLDRHVNTMKNESIPSLLKWQDPSRFWSDVGASMIRELQKTFAYGHDFKLFGYTPEQYFQQIVS